MNCKEWSEIENRHWHRTLTQRNREYDEKGEHKHKQKEYSRKEKYTEKKKRSKQVRGGGGGRNHIEEYLLLSSWKRIFEWKLDLEMIVWRIWCPWESQS